MIQQRLVATDFEQIISGCKILGNPLVGGQKTVYQCSLTGVGIAALKCIILPNVEDENDESKQTLIDTIVARANREVKIMNVIKSNYIVKPYSDIQQYEYKGQNLLIYFEEWIDGDSVFDIIRDRSTSFEECCKLCKNMVEAIETLWSKSFVHRDIKPQNIIRRKTNGDFVLLDMGVALDLQDKSLTQFGYVPGTSKYYSPEQLDYTNKRGIDFRSDLFSLGVVMYEFLTYQHPFYQIGLSNEIMFRNICNGIFDEPITKNNTIPKKLNDIVVRLLSSQPNSRYRKCSMLLDEIEEIFINKKGE